MTSQPNTQPEDGDLEPLKLAATDLIDKHFPKGQCKERGAAMVLTAELLVATEEWHKQALERERLEVAKAYGGCTNCYGKGYATTSDMWYGYDTDQDIGSPGGKVSGGKPIVMKFCTCDRGKQLSTLTNKDKDDARYWRRHLKRHGYIYDSTDGLYLPVEDKTNKEKASLNRKASSDALIPQYTP